MKALLFLLFIIVAFCSCLNQKYLGKNQVVFKVNPTGNGKSEIKAYNTGNNKMRVTLQQDSTGALLIQKVGTAEKAFILPTVIETNFTATGRYRQLEATGMYYFPETLYPVPGDANSNNLFIAPKKLKYTENNVVFQLVTTPLKIRPAATQKRLKDSLGVQALAELNIGASLGIKRTWGIYRAKANENGQNMSSVSLSGSGFFSIGGTNVKSIATRNFTDYDKTQPAISYGATCLFGFNNINVGISIGTDHLLKRSIGARWIFDGTVWYGITLAYDILK